MRPRCNGERPGVFLSGFICCLDEGHAGRCKPYQPPTVDEWRARNAAEAELERGLREALAYECGQANRCRRGECGRTGVDGPDLDAQVIAAVQRRRKQ